MLAGLKTGLDVWRTIIQNNHGWRKNRDLDIISNKTNPESTSQTCNKTTGILTLIAQPIKVFAKVCQLLLSASKLLEAFPIRTTASGSHQLAQLR